jgi:hypothetical protein
MTAWNPDAGPTRLVCVRCWSWDCAGCGPGRRVEAFKMVRQGILEAAARWPRTPAKFVTITYPNERDLRLENAADLKAAHQDLRRFIAACRRTMGAHLEYVQVTEPTARGRIHQHLVVTGPVFLRKCSDAGRRTRGLPTGRGSGSPCYCTVERPCVQRIAWALGMGWVKVQAIREAHRAAAYLGKYLSKGSKGHRWPRYARRLSTSREFSTVTFGRLREQFVRDVRNRRRLAGETETGGLPEGWCWTGPYAPPPTRLPLGVDGATGEVLLAWRSPPA